MKNAGIAFLLALSPSLLIGVGLLFLYLFQEQSSKQQFGIIPLLLGFLIGWGWGYAYLGHTLRAVAAFFSGYLVSFSVFMVVLEGIGVGASPPEYYKPYNDFAEVFIRVVLVVVFTSGIGLAIDAARLTWRHNQIVQKKQH